MPRVSFQQVRSYPFILDGGLDLTSSQMAKKPGRIIAGTGVEVTGGAQGYSRPGGYERCCDDVLPSETRLFFFEIESPTGGDIAVNDLFTSGDLTCRALDAISSPEAGDVIAVASHDTEWAADDILTGTGNGFTIAAVVTNTSTYTKEQLRAYWRQAIEQTRTNIPEITGTGAVAGGFRLRGKNYVFRNGKLLRGDFYDWTEIEIPQIMYFYEGVEEIKVGDVITDGTETATVSSVTVQAGSWNYTYDAVDQAVGYITTFDASGEFTADANLIIDSDTVPSLLTGDFASDANWTKGTGWSIGGGVATCSGAQTTTSDLSQAYTVDDSQSVAVTFTITRSAGTVKLFLGASESEAYDTAGTYTYVITRTTGDNLIGFRADADFAGTVDNVSVVVGRLAKVKTVNADYTLPTGGSYKTRTYNFTNVADADTVFGVSGVKDAFEFDGTTYTPILHPDFTDTYPFDLNIHQERLQLCFGGGQLVYSVAGQPRVYDSLLGAGSYSTGSEIVGTKKLHHNAEAIGCAGGVWLLLGTGVYDETTATRDWQFVEHDSSLGVSRGSIAEKGPSVFAAGSDLLAIAATNTTAAYVSKPVFEEAQPLLLANRDRITAAVWCRERSQHRLFFNTGEAMFSAFENGKPKGATSVTYPDVVRAVWSETEDAGEKIWFVSDDGYLYRMNSGNTFDDDYITGSFRLPFYHYGTPRVLKQFPQIILELDSPLILTGDTEITYTVNHAYGDPGYPRPLAETLDDFDSAGGFYGSNAGYGHFVWGGPIVSEILGYLDGYGPNMSILVTFKTKYDNPWTFISAIVDYVPLGIAGRER